MSGRFTKYIPVDHEEYKRRKLKAFEIRQDEPPRNSRFVVQRNILFKYIKKRGLSSKEIAQILLDGGEKITERGVNLAIQVTEGKKEQNNKDLIW